MLKSKHFSCQQHGGFIIQMYVQHAYTFLDIEHLSGFKRFNVLIAKATGKLRSLALQSVQLCFPFLILQCLPKLFLEQKSVPNSPFWAIKQFRRHRLFSDQKLYQVSIHVAALSAIFMYSIGVLALTLTKQGIPADCIMFTIENSFY